MSESRATLDAKPLTGRLFNLETAAGVMPLDAWVDVRNAFYRDDGTPERRAGFYSYHRQLDEAGSILETESPASYVVNGLHEFTILRNTQRFPRRLFVAKVDEFCVASHYGDSFDIPLARGLGDASHYPDFTTFYRTADRQNYLIVMTTEPEFKPSFWNGKVSAWGSGAGHHAKWGFLDPIEQLPSGRFSIEHNRRLFVASQDGTTVYYSAADDPFDFVNGGQFAVDINHGSLTGFFQTFYGELLIGQAGAIQKLVFDGLGLPQSLTPLTTEIGLVNGNSVAHIGGDIVYMASDGEVRIVQTTDRFGDLLPGTLSRGLMQDRFRSLPQSAWRAAFLLDDTEQKILWVGHSRGSGTRNDALTGWDYKNDRWLYAENLGIGAPACGAILNTSRWQRPKAHFGTYAKADGAFLATSTAGRIWCFNRLTKCDVFFDSSTEVVDTTTPQHLKARCEIPRNGGMPVTPTQVAPTGTYQNAAAYQTTVTVRALASGIVGTTASLPLELEERSTGQRGTILQNVGAAYAPNTYFNVEHATYDTGFNIRLPVTALKKHQEIHLVMNSGRKRTEVFSGDVPDLTEGMPFCVVALRQGQPRAFNFVSYLESAGMYVGSPEREYHLDGLSIVTRVIGNLADVVTNGEDEHVGQNQYRWHVDLYVRCDQDPQWSQHALLSGNDAQRYHLSESKAEAAGRLLPRKNLKHFLSTTGLESGGVPMGRKTDVNVHYVPIDRACKVFWLRLGQETMVSLSHDSGPTVNNDNENMRHGDFNVAALHVHFRPSKASSNIMGDGRATIEFQSAAVT